MGPKHKATPAREIPPKTPPMIAKNKKQRVAKNAVNSQTNGNATGSQKTASQQTGGVGRSVRPLDDPLTATQPELMGTAIEDPLEILDKESEDGYVDIEIDTTAFTLDPRQKATPHHDSELSSLEHELGLKDVDEDDEDPSPPRRRNRARPTSPPVRRNPIIPAKPARLVLSSLTRPTNTVTVRKTDSRDTATYIGAQAAKAVQNEANTSEGSTNMMKQMEGFLSHITQQWTKSEEEAFMALEVYNRHEYIAGLNRLTWVKPIRRAFPKLDSTNLTFINAKKKVLRDYKNWKSDVLDNAYNLVDKYIQGHVNPVKVGEIEDFTLLRDTINKDFHRSWFVKIFTFAKKHIDFDRLSEESQGYKWLRWVATTLMTHARLTIIHEKYPTSASVAEWGRDSLIALYDSLHLYDDFKGLTSADFPLLDTPLSARRNNKIFIDINNNPLFKVSPEFYAVKNANAAELEEPTISVNSPATRINKPNPIDAKMARLHVPKVQTRNNQVVGIIGGEVVAFGNGRA